MQLKCQTIRFQLFGCVAARTTTGTGTLTIISADAAVVVAAAEYECVLCHPLHVDPCIPFLLPIFYPLPPAYIFQTSKAIVMAGCRCSVF